MKNLYSLLSDTEILIIDLDKSPNENDLILISKNNKFIFKKYELSDLIIGVIIGRLVLIEQS